MGNRLRNMLRTLKTCWEIDENTLVHPEPSHWLHEISISKIVCHHFQPGLIPPL
jgi:hypothetical protein